MVSYVPDVRLEMATTSGPTTASPAWEDHTGRYLIEQPNTTVRGRANQLSDISPGTHTFRMGNEDGKYTPGNPASVLYPRLKRGVPVRQVIRHPQGQPGNFIVNSRMTDTSSWTPGGSVPPTVAPSTLHVYPGWPGLGSMLITWGAGGVIPQVQTTLTGLTIGRTYTAVVWGVYVPSGSKPVLLVIAGGPLGAASGVFDALTTISVTWTATANAHTMQIWPATSPAGGEQAWISAPQSDEGAAAPASFTPNPPPLWARFTGFLDQVLPTWPGGVPTWSEVSIIASDRLKLASQRKALRPFLIEEAFLDAPGSLYPLAEPSGAARLGDLVTGGSTGVMTQKGGAGTFTLGSSAGPPADGQTALSLAPSSATVGWYLAAAFAWTQSASPAGLSLEAWIRSSAQGDIASLWYGGVLLFGLALDSSKKLLATADYGLLTATSAGVVGDGAVHHVAAVWSFNGTNRTVTCYVDGVQVATASRADPNTYIALTNLYAGGLPKNGTLFAGDLANIAVYKTALSADRVTAHYTAGATGFGGESSDRRIARILSYLGLSTGYAVGAARYDDASTAHYDSSVYPATVADLPAGQAVVYGQATGGTAPLQALADVARTEYGLVLVSRDGLPTFQPRAFRYNLPVLATVEVEPGFGLVYDDQQLVNDVVMSTDDGIDVHYVNQPSVDAEGTYDQAFTLLTRDAVDAANNAAAFVNRNSTIADRQQRIPSLVVDVLTADDATKTDLLQMDISTKVRAGTLPTQAPAAFLDQIVEGYTETIGASEWKLTINGSPAAPYTVGVYDSTQVYDTARYAY